MMILIWSEEHQAFWRANRSGYTENYSDAGLYPIAQAAQICEEAAIGASPDEPPPETMLTLEAAQRRHYSR